MRQFLLGKNVAYPTSAADFMKVAAGALAVFVIKDGIPTLSADGSDVVDTANIVLGRTAENGGPVVIPINKRGFKAVKGSYKAATKFKATITIPTISNVGTYSLICVKKGKVFNDRHKWTFDTYIRDIDMTPAQVAEKLVKHINDNTVGVGLTATNEGATITIQAVKAGEDYNIIPADELMGTEVTINTIGAKAFGDATYVADLACKAAADAGFEYTFEEDIQMYKGYPLDPLDNTKAEDTGFTIYTLTFFEGRVVKNVDQVSRQIVQIAVPTEASCIATLDTIFEAIAGSDIITDVVTG